MLESVGVDAPQSQVQPAPASTVNQSAPAGHQGFTFSDILDVINPLQHLPVIGTVYRELTGDTISPAARVAGDALYGGIWGLASSVANELVEGETGKDIGSHIWATLFGDDDDKPANPLGNSPSETASAATVTVPAASAPVAAAAAYSRAPALLAPAAMSSAPAEPTPFFEKLQGAAHASHSVPLSTSIHVGNGTHAPVSMGPPTAGAPATTTASAQTAPTTGATVTNPGSNATSPTSLLPPPQNVAPQSPSATGSAVPPALLSGNIPDQMMKALDKYKAMAQQQNASGVSTTVLMN